MGIQEAAALFRQRAAHRVEGARSEGDFRFANWGLSHKRVFCYAEYDTILLPSGEPLRGTLLRENGIRVGHQPPPVWMRSFPTPINSMIGRDLCGEFQLLSAVGCLLDAADCEALQGEISLFSSNAPCVSCVVALRQFQLRFPRLRLVFFNGESANQ